MKSFNSEYIHWLTSNSRDSCLWKGRYNVRVGNAGVFPFPQTTANLHFFPKRPNNVLCRVNLIKYVFLNPAKPSHFELLMGFIRSNMSGVDQRKKPLLMSWHQLTYLRCFHTFKELVPKNPVTRSGVLKVVAACAAGSVIPHIWDKVKKKKKNIYLAINPTNFKFQL